MGAFGRCRNLDPSVSVLLNRTELQGVPPPLYPARADPDLRASKALLISMLDGSLIFFFKKKKFFFGSSGHFQSCQRDNRATIRSRLQQKSPQKRVINLNGYEGIMGYWLQQLVWQCTRFPKLGTVWCGQLQRRCPHQGPPGSGQLWATQVKAAPAQESSGNGNC